MHCLNTQAYCHFYFESVGNVVPIKPIKKDLGDCIICGESLHEMTSIETMIPFPKYYAPFFSSGKIFRVAEEEEMSVEYMRCFDRYAVEETNCHHHIHTVCLNTTQFTAVKKRTNQCPQCMDVLLYTKSLPRDEIVESLLRMNQVQVPETYRVEVEIGDPVEMITVYNIICNAIRLEEVRLQCKSSSFFKY